MVKKKKSMTFLSLSLLSTVTFDKSLKVQISTLVDCVEILKSIGIKESAIW